MSRKLIALVGPTGSGKTNWAKILARKFSGKIISADSRQVYKGMDIGTAKDKNLPQDLVDIVSPDINFSVADFQQLANDLIERYMALKQVPILVGGTGLYVEAVLYGYVLPELKKESAELREKLEKLSTEKIIEKLQKADADATVKIDPQNRRRLIRALEFAMLNKKPFSKVATIKKKPKFKTLILGIDVPREKLYARIDARVDEMIKNGLVDEVRELIKKYSPRLPALNTIGYKEIIDYLQKQISLPEAIQKIKFATHAYVRRQMTWFRRDKNIKWVKTLSEAEKLINKFLN